MPYKNLKKEFTTLIIRKGTRKRLQDAKVHPNQSNDEIINQLLDGKVKY